MTWLSLIWFILFLFVCRNLFCTIANLRIKCVTETKKKSFLFLKNLKSNFSTWPTHLTLRFLDILGYSGPRCATALWYNGVKSFLEDQILIFIFQHFHKMFMNNGKKNIRVLVWKLECKFRGFFSPHCVRQCASNELNRYFVIFGTEC